MNTITVALVSAAIALAALVVSVVTLWRTHFAMPRPIVIAGRLRFRIYPIKSEGERWYIGSYDLPLSISNPGAQPLLLSAIRLRLHFPKVPIPNNEELIPAEWEVDPKSASAIDRNRFRWLDKLRPTKWMPIPILPKSTVLKHLVFETRWNDPVIQPVVLVELQIKWSGSKGFFLVTRWDTVLDAVHWGELSNRGTSLSYDPRGDESAHGACSPSQLHKYTGSKEPIPTDGFLAGPSYLDFPIPNDRE